MFGSAKKVPTTCPHCGFVQMEPRGLISTYCRGCSEHYRVAPAAPAPKALAPRPAALAERLRQKLLLARPRAVLCHECGHEHLVPAHALATQCPACGTDVDLNDVTIHGHSTRVVLTRGTVHVGREGFLNATRVDCGHALVDGRIAGKVTCIGTIRLRSEGVCRARIRTKCLIIDRGANLRFTTTVYAEEVLIRAPLEADIVCAGPLHVGRAGFLEGDVQARSMRVDKGGGFAGAVEISPGIALPRLNHAERPAVRVLPGWQTRLAFGW